VEPGTWTAGWLYWGLGGVGAIYVLNKAFLRRRLSRIGSVLELMDAQGVSVGALVQFLNSEGYHDHHERIACASSLLESGNITRSLAERLGAEPTFVDCDTESEEQLANVEDPASTRPRGEREAIARLISAEQSGDLNAANRLGDAYRCGWGLEQDSLFATRLYRKAAEGGHLLAQYNLSRCFGSRKVFRQGIVCTEGEGSDAEGLSWLTKSASGGLADAQHALARAYLRGAFGLEREYGRYREWLQRACVGGHAIAQYQFGKHDGDCSFEGYQSENWATPEEVNWLRVSAGQGYVDAQVTLAYLCWESLRSTADLLGAPTASDGDPDAVKWFRRAAEQGSEDAQMRLWEIFDQGREHYLGLPVAKNRLEGIRWLRLAAEQGNSVAQSNLGLFYRDGLGVPADKAEAAKWLRLAASQGHAQSQYMLARVYHLGDGAAVDHDRARKWYTFAAEQGVVDAQICLGGLLFVGDRVRANPTLGYAWLLVAEARELGESRTSGSQSRLHKMMDVFADSLTELELEAAEQRARTLRGVISATEELRRVVWSRDLGAEMMGERDARYSQLRGRWAGREDQASFDAAARKADWTERVARADADHLRRTAVAGDRDAQGTLGDRLRFGWGMPVDEQEALEWYLLAAGDGEGLAQITLSEMYASGLGVLKNADEADKWSRLAASLSKGDYVAEGEGSGPD